MSLVIRSRVTTAKPHRQFKQWTQATVLIDDGEHADRPTIEQLIADEVHAPALVRAQRDWYGATMQAHVLAMPHAHAHLQALLTVEPMDAIAASEPLFSSKHDRYTANVAVS